MTRIFAIGVSGPRNLGGTDRSASDELASVSPDRTGIAFVRGGDLWLMNAAGAGRRRLLAPEVGHAFTDSSFRAPAWSPASKRLAVDGVSDAGRSPGETKCADWYLLVVDMKGSRAAVTSSPAASA